MSERDIRRAIAGACTRLDRVVVRDGRRVGPIAAVALVMGTGLVAGACGDGGDSTLYGATSQGLSWPSGGSGGQGGLGGGGGAGAVGGSQGGAGGGAGHGGTPAGGGGSGGSGGATGGTGGN